MPALTLAPAAALPLPFVPRHLPPPLAQPLGRRQPPPASPSRSRFGTGSVLGEALASARRGTASTECSSRSRPRPALTALELLPPQSASASKSPSSAPPRSAATVVAGLSPSSGSRHPSARMQLLGGEAAGRAVSEVGAYRPQLRWGPRGDGACRPRPHLRPGGAGVLGEVTGELRDFRPASLLQAPPQDELGPAVKPRKAPRVTERAHPERSAATAGQLDMQLSPTAPQRQTERLHLEGPVQAMQAPEPSSGGKAIVPGPPAASPREEPIWCHKGRPSAPFAQAPTSPVPMKPRESAPRRFGGVSLALAGNG
mmetsp:Transcript_151740/g.486843  ORF Transcript_151740/g.486843 Transcript_151740/m.486843 type:complete len:313 (+) Transcript_151740:33-971(+)